MVAIDGMFAGLTTVSLSNVPVSLSGPAAVVAPGSGPNQSQNALVRFTGALSADVTVTFPLPGRYIIQNFTTGNFNVLLAGVANTLVQAVPQGFTIPMYSDGSNFYHVVDITSAPGKLDFWAGISALPIWVTGCTFKPYLLCDGAVYNVSDYPYLGARLGAAFGGNGITTFGVPDLRGRIPLAYDGTGVRITLAGCGINGQTMGAAGGVQNNMLAANQIPTHTSVNAGQNISVTSTENVGKNGTVNTVGTPGSGTPVTFHSGPGLSVATVVSQAANSISTTYTNAGQVAVNNVQPAQVTGIWVIKV